MAEVNTEVETVESALANLRKMFPDRVVDAVHHEGGFWTIGEGDKLTAYDYWSINIYGRVRDPEHPHLKFVGATLTEAMDQVRSWHRDQEGSRG